MRLKEYPMGRSHIVPSNSTESKITQNFNVATTTNHFKKPKLKKYDKTNFDTKNSGQPDLDKTENRMKNSKKNTKLVIETLKYQYNTTHNRAHKLKLGNAITKIEENYKYGKYLTEDSGRKILSETVFKLGADVFPHILPKFVYSMYGNQSKKNDEFVENLLADLKYTLNRFYKSHGIDFRLL